VAALDRVHRLLPAVSSIHILNNEETGKRYKMTDRQ